MDKTQLKRHDLLYPDAAARLRLERELLNGLTGEKAFLTADIFRRDSVIPGIVRRTEQLQADETAVGFVHPQLCDGSRLRVAALLKNSEINRRQRPYALPQQTFAVTTACLEAAAAVCEYTAAQGLKLGILGSAGMEIATGLPFTNTASDLDLLITGTGLEELREVYAELQIIGRKFKTAIDLEAELANGYGVKAAEVFQPTQTVLGKSLNDVQILKKKTVVELLSQEA